jgi:ribonuclease P protein component
LAYRAPGSGPGTHQRLGLVIGKKNLRLASQRNRVKRIARELFRQQDQQSLPNLDLVLIARKGLEKLSNAEIRNILEPLFQKIYQQASQTNAKAPDYH